MAVRAKVPKDFKDPHLHCRTFGHTWRVASGSVNGAAFYRFVLVCDVCKTERYDIVNRRTGSATRRYEYPDGYRSAPGEGLTRAVYRIEMIRRLSK